jgi:hypothetical protein
MHKSATKCNETIGKWCKNKHGASKIINTLETYHIATMRVIEELQNDLKNEIIRKQDDDPFIQEEVRRITEER